MGLFRSNEIGSFEDISVAQISTGGSESNFAIGLSRLGHNATWLSRIGNDGIGRKIKSDILSQGVTVICQVDKNAGSGMMIKTTPRLEKTEVSYFRSNSAASKISASDFEAIDFSKYDALHFTGITPGLSASCKEATEFAIKMARKNHVYISMDVNYRSKIWSIAEAHKALAPLAPFCDLVVASVDEAQLLLNSQSTDARELATEISKLGPRHVVIKQGEYGATSLLNDKICSLPAIKVRVVDTVGAGDAFTASYIASFLEDSSPLKALERGVLAGALACTHPGDWQGMPYANELFEDHSSDPVKR